MKCNYSTTFNVPIKYVFDWCTDYRSDDNKISGAKYPRIILERTKSRAVFASYKEGSDGKPKLAVRVVTLRPAKYSWHLEYFGEEDLETAEYRLRRLGKTKTILEMSFDKRWKQGKGESRRDFEKHLRSSWTKYGTALEREYSKKV